MIYSIYMHTTVYQFWPFVYHHEQSESDHYARMSLYMLWFCTKIRLHKSSAGHLRMARRWFADAKQHLLWFWGLVLEARILSQLSFLTNPNNIVFKFFLVDSNPDIRMVDTHRIFSIRRIYARIPADARYLPESAIRTSGFGSLGPNPKLVLPSAIWRHVRSSSIQRE